MKSKILVKIRGEGKETAVRKNEMMTRMMMIIKMMMVMMMIRRRTYGEGGAEMRT